MKTLISTAVAAAFVLSGSVLADEPKPVELTAAQMDQVVAGVGAGGPALGDSAGVNGWGVGPSAGHGLLSAGFTTGTAVVVGTGVSGVIVWAPGPKDP